MAVEITQDELDIFSKNGITEDDIRNTVNAYRDEGVSDKDIRAKFDVKLNSFKNQTSAEEFKQNQSTNAKIPQNTEQLEAPKENITPQNGTLTGGVSYYRTNEHPIRENVRHVGREIARILLPKKVENWFLGSKDDEDFLKQYNDTNVKSYEQLKNEYDNGLISKNDLINGINLRNKYDTLSADDNYRQTRNLNIGKGIIDIGTAFVPVGGVGKLGLKGAQALTPALGKKLSQEIASGAIAGSKAGVIHGGATGLIDENINPLTQGAIEGGIGLGLGGGLGLAGGQIVKGVKARKLRKSKTNDLSKEEIKKLRDDARSFYDDYIKGTSVTRDDLGKIHFGNAGINEQVSKGLHNANVIPDLKKQIKTGKKQQKPRNDYEREDIKQFHIIDNKINNKNIEYQIAEDTRGNKYYFAKDVTKKEGLSPSYQNQNLGSEINPTNIMTDNAENFNPNITKSEDIKNISKKDMATNKREFKQSVEDLKAPKTKKTVIRGRYKNRFWTKNIDDPYTQATQEADEEFNSILNEIKKNPEVLNDEAKTMEFEARLDKKTSSLDDEHARDYWNKYWDAFSKGADYNQTKGNFDALGGREYKTRGAVNTISRKINSDVANSITDSKYLTRGYDVNKAQLDNMSMEEIQKLIESDDISDLSVTARAMDINRDLENGVIPLWKLNKWAADGTPIGQAMQARSLLKMDTPEGAIQVLAGTIRKATPKKVNDIIDNVPKLVEASNGGESALNETLKRVNKNERKYLIDKIMDLKNKGELTNDNLVKVINKKYNVPEITDLDYKNIQKLTADIQNATDERQTEVAKGLLRKYIGDKIPREFMNKVNTYRYTNMLLSPKSRVKDFLFTGLFQGEQALDEIIANGISKGLTQPIKGVKTRNGLHFNDWFQGLKKGLKEGAEDVKLGITTGRAGEGTRFDLPKSAQFRYRPLNEVEGFKKVPQALENVMSGLEKAVNYTIRVPDRMFYEGRYASSLADQLQSQGLKEATPEIIEQAVKEAKDAVYQGDTWASKASLGIRDTLNKIPLGAFKVGDWTMPFVQTVANISEEGLKNIGGVPVGAYKWLKADTPEALREAEILTAKGIKGLGLGAVGWGVGKGYFDSNIGEKTNYNDEITGMQPQSIAFKNRSLSLANAPNLAIPIAVSRAVGEKGFTREGIMQALLNAGAAVSDMPAFKAVGDLTRIVSNGYGQQLEPFEIVDNAVRNQGVNYISQLMPLGGLQRNIRNVIDPYGRELYTENTPAYIANRLINGIPFASQTLPLKYNAMGEPVMVDNIKNPGWRALGQSFDFGIRNYNKNATNETLNELSKKMEDSDIKGKTQIVLKKSKRTIKVNGENIKLDNKQYSKYQQEYGRLNYVLRDKALNDPEFLNYSDKEKTEYLMKLRQSVEEAVKIKQFGHEPTEKYKPYTQQILENYEDFIGE